MGLEEILINAGKGALELAGNAFKAAAEAGIGLEGALKEAGKYFGRK